VEIAEDDRITAYGLFLEAFTAVTANLERELEAAAGLSRHEFEVLLRLARTPGHHLRMTELAWAAHLSTSGMTRLVDRLEAAGLVERATCPNDRRGLEAVLTAKGQGVVAQVLPAHLESLDRHVVGPLNGKVDQLADLMRLLRDSAKAR
jgi:MarR family transcriptional regulator, 2-MHQ and catechol-resistance regulon repressor